MAFWGRNPFTNADLLVPFEGYVISSDRCVLAFVGWDESGGFIGAGIGESYVSSHFATATGGHVSDITVCARYLPENDTRLTWSAEYLLSVLRRHYDMKILSEDEHPWKCSVFDLDFSIPMSVNFLDESIIALNVRPNDSIGSIKMRILSRLRFKGSESTAIGDGFRLFHGDRALDEVNVSVSEYNADENFEEKLEPGALLRLEPLIFSDLSLVDVVAIKSSPEVFTCSPLPNFCPRLEVNFNFVRGNWGSTRIFHDVRASPFLSDIVMKRQCLWCCAFLEKNIVLPEAAINAEGYAEFVASLTDEEDLLFCGEFCFFRWLMFQGRLALAGQNYELIEVVSNQNWKNQCFQCGGFYQTQFSSDNSFELIAHFEDEGQEVLFMDRCCSRKCSVLSLQEITRFAKQDWPSYSFTKGMRRIECVSPIDVTKPMTPKV